MKKCLKRVRKKTRALELSNANIISAYASSEVNSKYCREANVFAARPSKINLQNQLKKKKPVTDTFFKCPLFFY